MTMKNTEAGKTPDMTLWDQVQQGWWYRTTGLIEVHLQKSDVGGHEVSVVQDGLDLETHFEADFAEAVKLGNSLVDRLEKEIEQAQLDGGGTKLPASTTVYQPHADHMPDDMISSNVFLSLEQGKAWFPDIPETAWLSLKLRDIENARVLDADVASAKSLTPETRHTATVEVVIPANAPEFASEQSYTAKMRVARVTQSIKAWRVADEAEAEPSGELDEHVVICMLADLRHYCDVHGLDFAKLDRHAYADYREQLANDRHHDSAK